MGSLDQFQGLFDSSMDLAERASLASKRVANVIDTMTYIVYRYISRGLYEKDRLSFKLLVLFNILVTAGRLTPSEVTLFLKGGAALDINAVKPKPVPWLTDTAWLNIVQLSSDRYKTISQGTTRSGRPGTTTTSRNGNQFPGII